jgi:hypothetical protein
MVSFTTLKDVLELRDLVENLGRSCEGEPAHFAKLTALSMALKSLAENTAEATAYATVLHVIKTALGEENALMDALLEKQNDAVRAKGNELRRKILQALQFVTGDCIVRDIGWAARPDMAIGDDPHEDPMVYELDMYGTCRSSISDYVEFLKFRVSASVELTAVVDNLSKAVAQLPIGSEMLMWRYRSGPPQVCTWFYNVSYLADSVERPGNKYSRSGLLTQLGEVELQLQECRSKCMPEEEISNNIDQHDWLYAACTKACSTWKTLASEKLSVPRLLSRVTARETGGAWGGSRKCLLALLQRLADLRE